MKSAYLMGTLLLLTACAGGGGGSSTPGSIVTPTGVARTSMQDQATNKSNIIAYVTEKLGNNGAAVNTGGTTSQSRNSTMRTISTVSDDNDKFNWAVDEYKNMYAFATDTETSEHDLERAYLLSGGVENDEKTDDQKKQHIKDNYQNILKQYFEWDNSQNKPNWNYKTSNLSDMKLQQLGARDWLNGYLRITQTKNGKIESIALKDGWFNEELDFVRTSNNKYTSSRAKYRMAFTDSTDQLSFVKFETDERKLTLEQIKENLLISLEQDDWLTESDKEIAKEKINNLSKDDVNNIQIMSQTEFEHLSPEETPRVLILTQSDMNVDVHTYGQQAGLRFSDFGTISGTDKTGAKGATPQEVGYVFAGGYDIKEIDKNIIDYKMEFAGNAAGKVMYHYENEDGVATQKYLDIAAAANLIFDNGTETLTANFSENKNTENRWYDVIVEFDGIDADLSLKNGDRIAEQNAKFKFDGVDTDGTFENITQYNMTNDPASGIGIRTEGSFTSTYYGDGITPTEAVGTVSFVQQEWKNNPETYTEEYNKEVNFMAGFGVVKK